MIPPLVASIAGKLLGSVAEKAIKVLWDYLHPYGGEDLRLLEVELMFILTGLEYLSDSEQTEPWKKRWMADARELIYDIEDVGGKFQHAGGDKVKLSEMKKFVREIMDSIKNFRGYFSNSADIRETIGAAAAAKEMFQTLNNMAINGGSEDGPRRRSPLACPDSTGLVGMDGPTKKIISLLDIAGVPDAEEGVRGDPIGHKVVAIVGVGGLGKTTLAAHVCNEIAGKFHCEARVFVTRNRGPREILISLLEQFGVNDCHHLQEITLVRRIQFHVKDKRFLVIFDDVWNTDLLIDVNNALFGRNCGGRVIITTRRTDVAEKWKNKRRCSSSWGGDYHIKPLNQEDSSKLLLQKVSPWKRQMQIGYMNKILAKCGGSPLALTAVSDVATSCGMEGQAIPWDEVYRCFSKIDASVDEISNMRNDLSHSYFDLPYEHRDCFLYLSLFPQDQINKKRLVSRWVAEGLIAQDKGKEMFKELVKRNLILKPKIKYDGDESIYQVHPTIHDFVVWKSAEYNFITLPGAIDKTERKIRRISIRGENIKLDDKELPDLRSLSLFGAGVPPKKMSSVLRVLDLEACSNGDTDTEMVPRSEKNISDIEPGEILHRNLRYLKLKEGLEGFELKRIGSAKNLQTLDLRGLGKIILDKAITDLVWLVRLLVDPETKLPAGIKKWEALEELQSIDVWSYDLDFLKELGQLHKLRVMGIHLSADYSLMKEQELLLSLQALANKDNSLQSVYINGVGTHHPFLRLGFWGKAIYSFTKFRMAMGCHFSKVPGITREQKKLRRLRLGLRKMNESAMQGLNAYASGLTHLFLDLSGDIKYNIANTGFQNLMCLGIRSTCLNMELTSSMGAPRHLKFQLGADRCTGTEGLPNGFYCDTDCITSRNNQQATTWTAVHIITPPLDGNENKEVVVAINIESRSAALSIMVNDGPSDLIPIQPPDSSGVIPIQPADSSGDGGQSSSRRREDVDEIAQQMNSMLMLVDQA